MRFFTLPLALAAVLAFAVSPRDASAQASGGTAPGAAAQSTKSFLEFAVSSARLQSQLAELAAGRDTRPEVKLFAQEMAAFRATQLPKLAALGHQSGVALPTLKEFEHQVIFENLEPLDFLALSRRYAEVQVQALEQEVGVYGSAARSGDPAVSALAAELIPQLESRLGAVRQIRQAVGP